MSDYERFQYLQAVHQSVSPPYIIVSTPTLCHIESFEFDLHTRVLYSLIMPEASMSTQ